MGRLAMPPGLRRPAGEPSGRESGPAGVEVPPVLSILYMDERLVAVDKPTGLLSTPSAQASDRVTCMSLLRDQLGHRVYPVHRLDRATSGVIVFGRSPDAARDAALLFRERQVQKRYLALVRGWLDESGTIDYPIEGAREGLKVEAVTTWRRLEQVELPVPVGRYQTARYSLVEARPISGRRHQIRRHFKHLRHPIVGDPDYGDTHHNRFFRERFGIRRLMLHAWALELQTRHAGGDLRIQAPVPEEMARILQDLGLPVPGSAT